MCGWRWDAVGSVGCLTAVNIDLVLSILNVVYTLFTVQTKFLPVGDLFGVGASVDVVLAAVT